MREKGESEGCVRKVRVEARKNRKERMCRKGKRLGTGKGSIRMGKREDNILRT